MVRLAKAFDALHGGGFAGAVGTDEAKYFAVSYFERYFVDSHRGAVSFAYAGNVNDRMHRDRGFVDGTKPSDDLYHGVVLMPIWR